MRGLGRVALVTWRQMRDADVSILASSLAFSTVISLVPLLAVSLSVFKAYGGFEVLMEHIEPFIMENFVEASGAQVSDYIRATLLRVNSGTVGFFGVLALFLTSTKVFLNFEVAIRRVWRERVRILRLRRLIVYWLVMFLGPLVFAVALGLLGSKGLNVLSLIPKKTFAVSCVFLVLLCIYKFVPEAKVSWRSALISAGVTAAGIGLAQQFYAKITVDILRYNRIYGSLASIPIFLLWIYLLCWLSLAGVALCAALEARRSKL